MIEHQDELTLLNGDAVTTSSRLNGDVTQGDVTPRLDDLEAAMMEDSTHTLKAAALVNGNASSTTLTPNT